MTEASPLTIVSLIDPTKEMGRKKSTIDDGQSWFDGILIIRARNHSTRKLLCKCEKFS
jgi:hypothetical protein